MIIVANHPNALVDPVVPPPSGSGLEPERVTRGNSLSDGARNRRHVWPDRATVRAKWLEKDLFAAWDPRVLDLYLEEGLAARADGQVELK